GSLPACLSLRRRPCALWEGSLLSQQIPPPGSFRSHSPPGASFFFFSAAAVFCASSRARPSYPSVCFSICDFSYCICPSLQVLPDSLPKLPHFIILHLTSKYNTCFRT